MQSKVLFNCLPTDNIMNPSAAFPILKSFLAHNHIESEIIYWNLLLCKEFEVENPDTGPGSEAVTSLLPYYYLIAREYADRKAIDRIITFYKKLNIPNSFIDGYDEGKLAKISDGILEKMTAEIEKTDFMNVFLWGLSGKCHQWIPGYILSKIIKQKNKEAKIVIGGFPNKDGAMEVLNTCKDIDFAIYGEGEYPLLELYNVLQTGSGSLSKIPRLIYRENNEIKVSKTGQSEFLDFQNYIYPDNNDFIKIASAEYDNEYLRLPINSIRSCRWNACNFCNYGAGYKYREREPEDIVREIEFLAEKYKLTGFNFVDNDIIGRDIKRFDRLLDLLIASAVKNDWKYSFWAQIILREELNASSFEKMAMAGFKYLFAGYEGVSDSLLAKMNKINRFANNILYLKFCTKYGIPGSVNIIKGIPDEAPGDVDESCKNLHFLRFFYHGNICSFSHVIGGFGLCKAAHYNKMVTQEEREKFEPESFCYYLPENMVQTPFNIFDFQRSEMINLNKWENFSQMEAYYKEHKYKYRILKHVDTLVYKEFLDEEEKNSFVFNGPEYFEIMNLANDKVISFEELSLELKGKFREISDEKIKNIISELKEKYIMYASEDYATIITVIDVSQVN